jgi:hypothetical protein
MRAFALSTAFAIICFAPPAIAAQFDGNWNMVAVTTSGHCGKIPIGLGINHGRIFSTGGRFARHQIQLVGRVSASGQVRMNAVAGPRIAQGTGRFDRFRGAVRGPVPGLPVSARAFGAPFAPNSQWPAHAIRSLQTRREGRAKKSSRHLEGREKSESGGKRVNRSALKLRERGRSRSRRRRG